MKIAICIPCHGDPRAAFTLSLAKLLLRDRTETLEVFMGSGGVVALVRERLVETAEKWGAGAILWLDSDQTFPADTIERLLAAGEPVIGANIPRRSHDARPTAEVLINGSRAALYTTREKAAAGEIESVHLMGLGVCLTSMDALKAIPRPIFNELREDHGLMRKLTEAGFTPKVDHALSAEVGHVGTYTWTNEHSLAALARQSRRVDLPVGGGTITGKLGPP
jgi:hypothetical protein